MKIQAKDKSTEIVIYEQIGADPWFGDGVSAKQFREAVKSVKTKEIDLRLNTPGGDVFEAVAMVAALDQFKKNGTVNVYVDGLAASAGSVIAMAGNRITMADGSMMMIHDPYTIALGNADEMTRKAELLTKIKDDIVKAYRRQSPLSPELLAQMMSEETWMTAEESVENGFAHEVAGSVKATAFVIPKVYGYRKAPEIKAPKYTAEQLEEHRKRIEWLEKEAA
jgi:ATP-dependent Clp protease, protease subunit